MEKKLVTVKFIYEGKQYDNENELGVLLPNGRVFVTKDSFGIYDAQPTDNPDVYVVNLDGDFTDYYQEEDEDFLIKLIVA